MKLLNNKILFKINLILLCIFSVIILINDNYFTDPKKWSEDVLYKNKQDNYIKKVLSDDYHYCIIIKNNDSLIGPFTEYELKEKIEELNISTKLQLKTEDEDLVKLSKIFIIISYLLLIECVLFWFIYLVFFIIRNLTKLLNKKLLKINLVLLCIFSAILIHNIFRNNISSKKITKNYFYIQNFDVNKNAIITKSSIKKDIIGNIVDYQINNEHILIFQEFDFGTYFRFQKYFIDYMDTNKYPNFYNFTDTNWEVDEFDKFKQDNYLRKVVSNDYNYYIIIKNNDSLIGPLTKAEFNKKRVELNVSTKLQLITENNALVVLYKIFDIIFYFLLIECLLYWAIFLVFNIIRNIKKLVKKLLKLFKINLILLCIFLALFIYENSRYHISSKEISKNYFFVENFEAYKNGIFTKDSIKKDIIGKILDYQVNNEHILILQKLDFHIYINIERYFSGYVDTNKYPIENDYYLTDVKKWNKYINDRIKQDKYISKAFSNDTNYYIIIKNNDSLIGPLTNAEFNKKRVELKISPKLKLITEDNFTEVLFIILNIIFGLLLIECVLYWPIFIAFFIIRNLIVMNKKT